MEDEAPLTFRIPFQRPWLLAMGVLTLPTMAVAGASAVAGQAGAAGVHRRRQG